MAESDQKQLQQALAQAMGQLQMEMQQQVVSNLTKVCFERCVSAPADGRLSDKQRRCLDSCASSFLEGFHVSVRVAAIVLYGSGESQQLADCRRRRLHRLQRSKAHLSNSPTFPCPFPKRTGAFRRQIRTDRNILLESRSMSPRVPDCKLL